MTTVIGQGLYAGLLYIVTEKEGKFYISLGKMTTDLMEAGANMKLLDDIGDRDPNDVMADFVETIPKQDGEG